MTTSAEQIAALIAANTDLKTFFEGERDQLIAARNNLPAAISRLVYVDAVNGLPGAEGTLANPLQDLSAAIDLFAKGQTGEIRLMSDATMVKRHSAQQNSIRITGWKADNTGTQRRTLTFQAVSSNTISRSGGFSGLGGFEIVFSSLDVVLPAPAAGVIGTLVGGSGMLSVQILDGSITGLGATSPLVASTGTPIIQLNNSTFANMAGLWVSGFPSGASLTSANVGGIIDPAITN